MTKKGLLTTAMLASLGLGMLTGCSDDKDETPAVTTNILDKFDANGQARVNVAIYTPFGMSTRANDDFPTEYDPNEYAVKDATLIIFTGTLAEEANAKFQGAYTLTDIEGSDNIANNIERVYTATIDNDHVQATSGLLALVVANKNNQFTVDATDNTLTVTTTDGNVKPTKGVTTFEQFRAYQLANIGTAEASGNGLLMANAPLANVFNSKNASNKPSAQATVAVTTLAEVDASKIQATATAAKGDPAITVYLERAAAKVELLQSISDGKLTSNSAATFTPTEIRWLVDNVEPSYFSVRNPGAFNTYADYSSSYFTTPNYRFFGATAELSGGSLYRTYWAKDPHYDYTNDYEGTPTAETALNCETDVANIKLAPSTASAAVYQYITENTMNENGLSKDKTTRVLISIKFNGGDGFFTLDNGDILYQPGAQGTDGTLAKQILAYVKSLPSVTTWLASNPDDITVTVTEPTAAGKVTTGITVASAANNTTLQTALTTDGFNAYSSLGDINYYAGGMAYYQARIQHFGDDETPLRASGATPEGSSYKVLYCDGGTTANAQNFLGRYGVVRNNWYVLNLQSVKHMGSATIPFPPGTTPDDEIDQYLGIKMYVMKWAKRTQTLNI